MDELRIVNEALIARVMEVKALQAENAALRDKIAELQSVNDELNMVMNRMAKQGLRELEIIRQFRDALEWYDENLSCSDISLHKG